MRKVTRKLVCLLLVFLMLTATSVPLMASAATTSTNPVVYIRGVATPIYDKNGVQIYPLKTSISQQLVNDKTKLTAAFMSSWTSGNWSTYCDALYDSVAPLYADLVLNNDGEISDGSYSQSSATPKNKTSGYVMYDYIFNYDFRVDPITTAAKLSTFINSVISATGKSKVNIVARCYGSSIAAAYLTKYGASKIDTCVFYASACNGILPVGATFSGRINVDADSIAKYTSSLDDSEFSSFAKSMVTLVNQAKLLGLGTDAINSVYHSVADQILPELILATYGTMPGYWSMVGDEYYEDAKAFVFNGVEKQYAGLIEKLDNYHYNVQLTLPSTLQKLKKAGLKIAVIAKYNKRLAPVFENCNIQADDTVEVATASFGATCANIGNVLSKSYLEEVAAMGLSDYVSKDSIIDSSTCLFPDNTWFIKNLEHSLFPTSVDELILEICSSSGQYTIRSSSKYPQFLEYNSDNTLTPVTSLSTGDLDSNSSSSGSGIASLLSSLIKTFTGVLAIIIKILSVLLVGG